jgi:ADP-dependent glucokinase
MRWTVLACATVVLAGMAFQRYLVNRENALLNSTDEQSVLRALQRAANEAQTRNPRFAIGLNANLDVIVSAASVLNALRAVNVEDPESPWRTDSTFVFRDSPTIDSLNEFSGSLASYFKDGSAVERIVTNQTLFQEIIDDANALNPVYSIGGNAALMAQAMVNSGSKVLLGGFIGPKLQKLLDPRIEFCDDCTHGSDEYHLILEYSKGETIGQFTSHRANRYILSHDITNAEFLALENFQSTLLKSAKKIDFLVLAGVHLLGGLEIQKRKQMIDRLVGFLRKVKKSNPCIGVHLELASIADKDLIVDIANAFFPYIDSLGLNEQELNALHLSLSDQDFDSVRHVEVPDVLQKMQEVFDKFPQPTGPSRIHFHSLEFHIVSSLHDSWIDSTGSVSGGSLAGSTKACGLTDVSVHSHSSTWKVPSDRFKIKSTDVLMKVETEKHEYSIAPVLVCRNPQGTVGLGDVISATGLKGTLMKCRS